MGLDNEKEKIDANNDKNLIKLKKNDKFEKDKNNNNNQNCKNEKGKNINQNKPKHFINSSQNFDFLEENNGYRRERRNTNAKISIKSNYFNLKNNDKDEINNNNKAQKTSRKNTINEKLKENQKIKKEINSDKNGIDDIFFDEVIFHENKYESSKCMQTYVFHNKKFPDFSSKPFSSNKHLTQSQNNDNIIKEENEININPKIITYIEKSSSIGSNNKESTTKQNSSNFSSTEEILNSNSTATPKNENNNINWPKQEIENKYKQLLLLAKRGDYKIFSNLLNKMLLLPKNLIDLNYHDGKGFTALNYACNEGNIKIVEILLKAKCDPNIINYEKESPLHLASKKGYFEICRKLIENGALLNMSNFEKNTPIHYVCMNNDVKLLKYFLTKFPKVDSKNIFGKMPIDLTNSKEIKELLENYLNNSENKYKQIKAEISKPKIKKYISKKSQNFEKRNKNYFKKNTIGANNKTSISPISKSPKKKIECKSPNNIIINKNYKFKPFLEKIEIKIKKKNTFQKHFSLKKSNSLNNFEKKENNDFFEINISDNNIKQNRNILSDKNVLKYNLIDDNLKNELSIDNNIIKRDVLLHNKKKNIYCSTKMNLNNDLNKNLLFDNNISTSKTITRLNKYNLNSCINKAQIINKSKINNSKIMESVNYGYNRINLSINTNIEKADISIINNLKQKKVINVSNKQKYNETNNNKLLLINSLQLLNNNEIKSKKKSKNHKNLIKKDQNNSGQIETEALFPRNMKKPKKRNEKKISKGENINNSLNNNCNLSKISNEQNKKNIILNLKNKANLMEKTIDDKLNNQFNLNPKEKEKISLTNFVCLAKLGKGSFGEVYLVQKINSKKNYAMKVLRKDRILNNNLMKYAIVERNVLKLSNNPFIVKLYYAFQTSSKLFLVLEYCPNGDLSKHLLIEKRFSEKRAKFYLCEVLLALEDLHKRDIIFRDLKPENVILDEEGHCKLTDFGLSKEGISDNQYAQSFCGSLAYLAPEMLKKTGHGKPVDWYLLGVLFYEMLIGVTPYFSLKKEDIFNNIENGELKIPDYISKEAADLLRRLLERDPNKRLGGSIKDAQEIKEHSYFKDVDWRKMYKKEIKPPIFMDYMSKMIHYYHKPRIFANEELLNSDSDKPNPNMLMGWSFINNEKK